MQPKKGMCSVNAHCLQEQRFSVHPGGVFVLQTDMRMEHIPYADCFKVQSFWKVRFLVRQQQQWDSVHVVLPACCSQGMLSLQDSWI
jgi:hypothetical protein